MSGVDELRRMQRIFEAAAAPSAGPAQLRLRGEAELGWLLSGREVERPPTDPMGRLGVERLFGLPVILDERMSPGAFALVDGDGNLLRLFVLPGPEPEAVVEDLDEIQLEWILIACIVVVATVWTICAPALLLGRGF